MNIIKRSVGICAPYGSHNHGTNLQAIGLSQTLRNLGYDPVFVNKFRVFSFMLKHPIMLYGKINRLINTKRTRAFYNPIPYHYSEQRAERIRNFNKLYFKDIAFQTASQWEKAQDKNMIFIAGSDIIWNPVKGYPTTDFLDFAYYAGLERFSYASSVGSLELPKKYHRAYKRYLGSMKAVSVREQSVADMLKPIIGRDVIKVVDPSMLLTKDDWSSFAENAIVSKEINSNEYILSYFVMNDPQYWEYMKTVAEKTKLQIVVLPMHHLDEEQPYDVITDATAHEFVYLIKNAKAVCTDSFHACVVSTIFNKDFYLLKRDRKAEKDKYADLLTRYHLNDRVVDKTKDFIHLAETDYSFANQQIPIDRKFSMDFLKNALN